VVTTDEVNSLAQSAELFGSWLTTPFDPIKPTETQVHWIPVTWAAGAFSNDPSKSKGNELTCYLLIMDSPLM